MLLLLHPFEATQTGESERGRVAENLLAVEEENSSRLLRGDLQLKLLVSSVVVVAAAVVVMVRASGALLWAAATSLLSVLLLLLL